MQLKDRFLKHVSKTDSCWIWLGARTPKGYGKLNINFGYKKNKLVNAHRISYELFNGQIPKNLCVCHSCDNRLCVNPEHLFLGTNKDNVDDRVSKNRSSRPIGESNGRARLSWDKVCDIRNKYLSGNYTQLILSEQYNVSEATICFIVNNKTWTI